MSLGNHVRLAAGSLVALVTLIVLALTFTASGSRADAAPVGVQAGLPVAREVVTAKATGMTGIIRQLNRTESKLSTISAFLAVQPNNLKQQSVYPDSKEVWLVAMAGRFHAMFSPVPVPDDNWIVIAYDATTAQPLAMMSGRMNTWPLNWAKISDQAKP